MIFSLSVCLLLSGCNAIKEVIGIRQSKTITTKKRTNVDLSASEQISPIKGRVISPFGHRDGRSHTGTDIKLQKGDTVKAAFSGKVARASSYSGYGNLVIIKHANNMETYYAHLSKCLVQVGDSVLAGTVVGLGGRTGRATTDHLHFEVRYKTVAHDPENFFDFGTGTARINFLAYTPVLKIKNEQKIEQRLEANLSEDVVVIQKGDTLYALALRYKTTVNQLRELNDLQSSNLKLGMKLKIR